MIQPGVITREEADELNELIDQVRNLYHSVPIDGQQVSATYDVSNGVQVTSDLRLAVMCYVPSVPTGNAQVCTGAMTTYWDNASGGAWYVGLKPVTLKNSNNQALVAGQYYAAVEQLWDNTHNQPLYTTAFTNQSATCCTIPTPCCSTGGNVGFPQVMNLSIVCPSGGDSINGSFPMAYQPVLNVFAPITMQGIQGAGWAMSSNLASNGQIFATTFFCYTTSEGGSNQMAMYFVVGTGTGQAVTCIATGSGESQSCPSNCDMASIINSGGHVSFSAEILGAGVNSFFNLSSQ